ncbi:MAG: YfhO family protein, partial [Planctomycetales bacterium]|nr:YfhO family protein [Planctomycetales bacterium]
GPAALLAAVAADLALVNGPVAATIPVSALRGPSAAGRALPSADPREWRLLPLSRGDDRSAEADIVATARRTREALRAKAPLLEGRATVRHYETGPLAGYLAMVEGPLVPGWEAWMGALAVRDVVSDVELPGSDLERAGSVEGPLFLYRNRRALPRARLVGAFEEVSGFAGAARRVREPGFPHAERILLDPAEAAAHREALGSLDPAAARAGRATLVRDAGDAVLVETDAPGPTLLVLADSFYPGWEATVDGSPAPLLRANGAFRAVPVPAGRHEVAFRLRSRPLAGGLALTGLGLAAWCILLRWGKPWRQSGRGRSSRRP